MSKPIHYFIVDESIGLKIDGSCKKGENTEVKKWKIKTL